MKTDSNTYPLFGKVFRPSQTLINYNIVHKMCRGKADELRHEFSNGYKRFNSIDAVVDQAGDLWLGIMGKMSEYCVKQLNSNNIFDYSANQFFEHHTRKYERLLAFPDIFELVENKYEAIIDNDADRKAYRAARKQGRGRWVGGGFGFSGAIKGAAKAGMLNAGSGLMHGTVNMMGNMITSAGSAMKKAALFADSSIRPSLEDAVYKDCYNMIQTFVDALQKHGKDIQMIQEADIRKAEYLFKQLRLDSPKNNALDTMIEILALNPYNLEYFVYMLKRFDDENNELENMADNFGFLMQIQKYKKDLVRDYYKQLPTTTLEKANESKKKLIDYCKKIGGAPKEFLDELEATILKLKIVSASEKLKTLPINTEEEALESKEKLLAYCKEIKLSEDNPAVTQINEVLARIDRDLRTVEGIEFATRDLAKQAKSEKSAIDTLINEHNKITRGDYVDIRNKLTNGVFKTGILPIYVERIERQIKDFDKKLKKAKHSDYRIKNKTRIYSGNITSFIVGVILLFLVSLFCLYVFRYDPVFGLFMFLVCTGIVLLQLKVRRKKEKKAWVELTHSGAYDISTVESGLVSNVVLFCNKCGSEVIDDGIFCNKCGTKLIDGNEEQQISFKSVGIYLADPTNPKPKIIPMAPVAQVSISALPTTPIVSTQPKIKKWVIAPVAAVVIIIAVVLVAVIGNNQGSDSFSFSDDNYVSNTPSPSVSTNIPDKPSPSSSTNTPDKPTPSSSTNTPVQPAPTDNVSGSRINPDDVFVSVIGSFGDYRGEYAFYDIDGNGVDEMIISYDTDMDSITKIYTYTDGMIYELGEFWSRSRLTAIDKNGTIYRSESNDAANSSFDAYCITSDCKSLAILEIWEADYNTNVFTHTINGGKNIVSEQEYNMASSLYDNNRGILGDLVWLPIPSSSGDGATQADALLRSDEARQIYNAWLAGHPDMSEYTLSRLAGTPYELNGEQYYLFHADDRAMYRYNILVNMKTGELILMMTPDGPNPVTTYEPLDDWYDSNHITYQAPSNISFRDNTLPPDQYVGDIFPVRGILESNYLILSVFVAVYNDSEVIETSSITFPNAYTYDIRNLDYDLIFDRLTPGYKTYIVMVENEMETVYFDHQFWVYRR